MNRQKSFEDNRCTLYLVPTPIGNLSEMTERALQTLKEVDVIAAEDTRNTLKLLHAYGISTPVISHHEHNQKSSIPVILQRLKQDENVALVSDAGYPLVSDPGQNLVQAVIEAGYPVVSMSGANAALNALVASGLDTHHYYFYGFLDHKQTKRKKELEALKDFPNTIIFYEAPHRIAYTLADMQEVFGDRPICLARELTKRYEEYLRGSISEVREVCESLKGEMVLVVQGKLENDSFSMDDAVEQVLQLEKNMRFKEAVKVVSAQTGCSKNELYQAALKKKEGN